MIRSLLPAPLTTGRLREDLWVVRDGFVNFYVLGGSEGLVCIDAGWRAGHAGRSMAGLGLNPADVVAVLLTHTHWDHAWGARAFPAATVLAAGCHRHGSILDGEVLDLGGRRLRVIACPGHTASSVAYLTENGDLFSGDSLWLQAGQAHPNPWYLNRDNRLLRASLRRLAGLGGLGALYTGHTGSVADAARALSPWLADTETP